MTELGDYLRSRRALVTPAEVGLSDTGHRRVPGLRREEVALLGGLSVDYYVRLEQGRERSPSAQVLEALAAALKLDEDGRQHLFAIAGLTPRARLAPVPDRVAPALLRLMAAWPDNPALVYNRAYDLLATNTLSEALYGDILRDNMLLMVFTEPRARELYADWPVIAADAVAGFRKNYGIAPHDPRITAVLTELLDRSPEFTELWRRHDARGKSAAVKSFRHPQVGTMTLDMQTFDVRSGPGQELVVYQAEPNTPSADALKLLGSLAATAGT